MNDDVHVPGADDEESLTPEEKRALAQALSKAWRGIDAMRTLFWTCVVVGVLWALLAAGWWSVAGGVFAAVNLGGALQVRKQPALWATIVAACAMTIGAALLVLSLMVISVRGILGGAFLLISPFFAVRRMRRAERLIAAYPDHYAARRITGKARRKRR